MHFPFFNAIHIRLINFETFCMIVLSDVRPLYTHTSQKNGFVLSWKTFYLKSVNFPFFAEYIFVGRVSREEVGYKLAFNNSTNVCPISPQLRHLFQFV